MRGFVFGIAAVLAFAPAARADELTVNRALDGASGAAAAVTDGDASTTYCPDGPVVVDLGRPTALSGAGATLVTAAPVKVELSNDGRRWDSAGRVNGVAGGPAYDRFSDRARFARFTTEACVGEFRLFGEARQLRALGSDLSFTL